MKKVVLDKRTAEIFPYGCFTSDIQDKLDWVNLNSDYHGFYE